MTKLKFLLSLNDKLAGLPRNEIEDRLNFYSEMIEDRMEDGLSEEEAVAQVGDVDDIAAQIIADTPFAKIAKEKLKSKRRLKTWEIVLLAVGSPIWVSLLVAAVAVIFSLYVSLWSVIVSLWAAFGSIAGAAFGAVVMGMGLAFSGNAASGIVTLGAGVVCAGLAIFAFFGCLAATKATLALTKNLALWSKKGFLRMEGA